MIDLIDRQAAIDRIEEHLRFGDELYPLTETDEILNYAFEIAASCVYNLPSAQPEIIACGQGELVQDGSRLVQDLISRQAAIRWVKTECNPYGKPTLDFESSKKVIEHLKQMPSAQPDYDLSDYSDRLWKAAYERGKAEAEVKHGKWIKVGDNSYRCSVCGDVSCCMGDYCPDCGAKMRKETEDGT